MALKDIPKFERLNNVSISVYRYQEGKEDREGFVYPLKASKEVLICFSLSTMIQTTIVTVNMYYLYIYY